MKNVLIFILLLTCTTKSFAQNNLNGLTHLGVVSQFSFWKATSEGAMLTAMQNDSIKKNKPRQLAILKRDYNTLYTMIAQFIMQLNADLTQHNRLKIYRKLDEKLSVNTIDKMDASTNTKKKLANYYNSLIKINSKYQAFMKSSQEITDNNGNDLVTDRALGIGDIKDAVTTISGIFKDYQAAKATKISAIVKMLDGLKLTAVSDLGKDPKKDDAADSDKAKKDK